MLRWLRFSLVTQVSTLEEGAFNRSREMKRERDGRAFDGRRDEIEMNSGDVGVRSQSGEQAASGVVSPPPPLYRF